MRRIQPSIQIITITNSFHIIFVIWFRCFIGTGIPGTCQECPIYDAFDWNMPMMTTIVTAVALVLYAVIAGLYTILAPLKKQCG